MCGGTENQFMTLSRRLDPSRFELEFACLRRWGPFVDEIAERQIPLAEYRVTSFRSVRTLAEQARLFRHISRRQIDVVHTYNFYGNVFGTFPAWLAGAVVVASIRDRAPYLTSMQKRVQRYACTFADCILVNADAVKTWLVGEGYDESRIIVIRNGVDMRRFDVPRDPERLTREFALPPGTPLVGVVSRLTRLKGLEELLEAAAMLRPRHPEVRYLIVGETAPHQTAYLEELKRHAAKHRIADRVIFTGLRRDVPSVLAAVDVSVMPSLNEALSNVVLESMAAGAPTVATRVGGTPEAMEDGRSGLLVAPGDASALAAAISRLLEDRRLAASVGSQARQQVRERFSLEQMTDETERLYFALLARKQRAWCEASV
jgi:glycosyltransferase involved in cell wall biosynthesis